jgi:hypothetical protein
MFTKLRMLIVFAAGAVAGCGGGGGGDDDRAFPPVTYMVANGLTWSSTTSQTAVSRPGLYFTLDVTPQSYCTQETCSNGACHMSNFNNERGWRVPTRAELKALHAAQPRPPGWVIGGVWSSSGGWALDFNTGREVYSDADSVRNHVTCVKAAT